MSDPLLASPALPREPNLWERVETIPIVGWGRMYSAEEVDAARAQDASRLAAAERERDEAVAALGEARRQRDEYCERASRTLDELLRFKGEAGTYGDTRDTYAEDPLRAENAQLSARVRSLEAQQASRAFWVLERPVDGQPVYWDGGHAESFTTDIHKAVQFCRRDDAGLVCAPRHYMQWGWNYVEHMIIAPPADPGEVKK